ncbi:hypothetical protein TorRG33x02_008460 [Trema orientale]|uniref:Uncharacterized protein n=1 Tax=Trema orientale TaxID=63057 RepID=A0A2P5G0U5_TREOI|nr:hypothetical protein TorRG33x02_008460 [Trema orientale]
MNKAYLQCVIFCVFQRSCAGFSCSLHGDLLFLENHIGMLKFHHLEREREREQLGGRKNLSKVVSPSECGCSITNHYYSTVFSFGLGIMLRFGSLF